MYFQSRSSSTSTIIIISIIIIIKEITTVNTEKGLEDSRLKWIKNRLIHVHHSHLTWKTILIAMSMIHMALRC